MISFLADHCFDEDMLRAIQRRAPAVDVILARAAGLAEAGDAEVLAWAAGERRVIITHDRNTMIAFALDRIRRDLPMSGLIVVKRFAALARLVEDIVLLAECTELAEWKDRIAYVPF